MLEKLITNISKAKKIFRPKTNNMTSNTAPAPRQITAAGRKVAALSMLVTYKEPIFKAGKLDHVFTFRGDMQCKFFSVPTQFTGLVLTLHREKTLHQVTGFTIYDNRPESLPYPQNIIISKLDGVIMHDHTALYPAHIFDTLAKYKLI